MVVGKTKSCTKAVAGLVVVISVMLHVTDKTPTGDAHMAVQLFSSQKQNRVNTNAYRATPKLVHEGLHETGQEPGNNNRREKRYIE